MALEAFEQALEVEAAKHSERNGVPAIICLRIAYEVDSGIQYQPTTPGFFEIIFSNGESVSLAEGYEV
jgi:hypothetical protein